MGWAARYLPHVELRTEDLRTLASFVELTQAAEPHHWLWEEWRPRPWAVRQVPLEVWQAMKHLAARELAARRAEAEAERRARLDFDDPEHVAMLAKMAGEIRTGKARRRTG